MILLERIGKRYRMKAIRIWKEYDSDPRNQGCTYNQYKMLEGFEEVSKALTQKGNVFILTLVDKETEENLKRYQEIKSKYKFLND